MELEDRLIENYYSLSDIEGQLVSTFSKLNEIGQQKAVEHVETLAKVPEYQKDEPAGDEPNIEALHKFAQEQENIVYGGAAAKGGESGSAPVKKGESRKILEEMRKEQEGNPTEEE